MNVTHWLKHSGKRNFNLCNRLKRRYDLIIDFVFTKPLKSYTKKVKNIPKHK